MGVTMEYAFLLSTRVVEHDEFPIGKTNTPLRKEFVFALNSNNEICQIRTPFNSLDLLFVLNKNLYLEESE